MTGNLYDYQKIVKQGSMIDKEDIVALLETKPITVNYLCNKYDLDRQKASKLLNDIAVINSIH